MASNYQSGSASLFASMARGEPVKADWRRAFASWLERNPTQKGGDRNQTTIANYLGDVRTFEAYFEQVNGSTFEPGLLNATDVKGYFGLSVSPATYNRRLASLRMLAAWAREFGFLDYDPTVRIMRMDATRESPRDVLADEWERLEAVTETRAIGSLIGLRDLLIFRLMGSAGLRIHETVGLRLDDLHLDDGYIYVLGKGQKHRKVRVGGKLVQAMRDWLAVMPASVDGTLVTDLAGNAIDRVSAWRRFESIAEAAGVKTTPHAMRHTYIYRFMDHMMAGDKGKLPAAIDAVCQQTGDRPEVILQYYTRARESDIRAVAEEM